MAVCAISGVGMATNPSAAVCVRGVGHHTAEEQGLCVDRIAHLTDLTKMADFAIQSVERSTQG